MQINCHAAAKAVIHSPRQSVFLCNLLFPPNILISNLFNRKVEAVINEAGQAIPASTVTNGCVNLYFFVM